MKAIKDIRLLVNGEEFTGWDRYQIEQDLLQPSDAFSLAVPNIDAKMTGKIKPGDAFSLVLDGTNVMSGHIDDVNYDTAWDGSRIEVVGRDEFSFLVDCSATPGTYRKVDVLIMAERLTAPWSMAWSLQTGITLTRHSKVKVEPGDTPLDVIVKLAEKDNLLVWYTSDGVGVIGTPNYTQAVAHKLRLYTNASGKAAENNIIRSRVRYSIRDRFSTYTVAGTGANGADTFGRKARKKAIQYAADFVGPPAPPKVYSPLRVTQADEFVASNRPLIVNDADAKTIKQINDKCTAERTRREFDSIALEYVVRGHYGTPVTAGGVPVMYDGDQRADVVDQPGGIQGVWYITKRRFGLDRNGPTTELELHPDSVWLT